MSFLHLIEAKDSCHFATRCVILLLMGAIKYLWTFFQLYFWDLFSFNNIWIFFILLKNKLQTLSILMEWIIQYTKMTTICLLDQLLLLLSSIVLIFVYFNLKFTMILELVNATFNEIFFPYGLRHLRNASIKFLLYIYILHFSNRKLL